MVGSAYKSETNLTIGRSTLLKTRNSMLGREMSKD